MNQSSSQSKKDTTQQGITGIAVRGYKSLYEECSIEVRPLTILAGANSSGKSSIMQPLLLMKQTLEATYDPGALLLNGPNVKFTLASQLLSEFPDKECDQTLMVKVMIEGDYYFISNFIKETGKSIDLTSAVYKVYAGQFHLDTKIMDVEIVPNDRLGLRNLNFILSYLSGIEANQEEYNKKLRNAKIKKNRVLLEFKEDYKDIVFSSNPGAVFEPFIRQIIHVPGLMGNPERNYKVTPIVENEFPGTLENYVASIINHWQKEGDYRLDRLGESLVRLGLTSKVQAQQLDDTQVELLVARLPGSTRNNSTDMVSIADVGFGVSQVLPALVALLVANPGQLVYLEQPEIHLHPRAQVALGEILAEAANRGVKVVVETHSDRLLLSIQSLVAEGQLSPDLVKLHWFTRREDGVTEVASADLDETGAFGNWPEDFGDVSMQLESRYLDAAESRLLRQ